VHSKRNSFGLGKLNNSGLCRIFPTLYKLGGSISHNDALFSYHGNPHNLYKGFNRGYSRAIEYCTEEQPIKGIEPQKRIKGY